MAYTGTTLDPSPSPADLNAADLGIGLRAIKLELDPNGSNTFALLGDVSSRIMLPPEAQPGDAPKRIPFAAGYANDAWNAELCTGKKEGKKDKISILLAEMYLDPGNGGSATLTVTNDGKVDVSLSGTVKLPDVAGGGFEALVTDLSFGSSGITVGEISGEASGQEMTLFDGNLFLRNDNLAIRWNDQNDVNPNNDALEFDLSGSLWLVPYQCGGAAANCAAGEGASFQNLVVDTRGNVAIGSANVNLLGSGDDLMVFGSDTDPTLAINTLGLQVETPSGASSPKLGVLIGGRVTLPDVMEGATSDFDLTITTDENGEVVLRGGDQGLRFRFAQSDDTGDNPELDTIGDNTSTEFGIGDIATIDVKEAGVKFEQDNLAYPAIYANAAVYIKPEENKIRNVVRLGALGSSSTTTAGLYINRANTQDFTPSVAVNVTEVRIDSIGLELFSITKGDIELKKTQGGTLQGFVFAGTFQLNTQAVSGSARWAGLEIDRDDGLVSIGQLDGDLSLSIKEIIDLSVGGLDYGTDMNVEIETGVDEETGESITETVFAQQYFELKGVSLTLPLPGSEVDGGDSGVGAGVDRVLFVRYDNGASFRLVIEKARLNAGPFASSLSFDLTKQPEGIRLFAVGMAKLDGLGEVALAGAFENVNDELSFGLAIKLESDTPIPIIPQVIGLDGLYGGFVRNPTQRTMETIFKSEAFPSQFKAIPANHPSRIKTSDASSIEFGVYLGIGGQVIYAEGEASVLSATIVIAYLNGPNTQKISLMGEGVLYGQKEILIGLTVSVSITETRKEVNGYAGVLLEYPKVLEGKMGIGFQVFKQDGNDAEWAVAGKVGGGTGPDDEPLMIAGFLEAKGEFLACRDGVIGQLGFDADADIWIITFESSASIEAWWVNGTPNLGAYFEAEAKADFFFGNATLEADIKGAYIHRETLFYGAASGRVTWRRFDGTKSIWVSFKAGEGFDGGKGSNSRYERLIADARADATAMITAAGKAKTALADAKNAVTAYAIPEAQKLAAGAELIGAPLDQRRNYHDDMYTIESLFEFGSNDLLLVGRVMDEVVIGDRSAIDQWMTPSRKSSLQARINALQAELDVVITYLDDLEAESAEWDAEALALAQDLSSPVGPVTELQISGGTVVSAASFSVDKDKANRQATSLDSLSQATRTRLDSLYVTSIGTVASNLAKLDAIMSKEVSLFYSSGGSSAPATASSPGASTSGGGQPAPPATNSDGKDTQSSKGATAVYRSDYVSGGTTSQTVKKSVLRERMLSIDVPTVTVNEVAEDLVGVTDVIETIHDDRARSQWGRRDWARETHDEFVSGTFRESKIRADVEQMTNRLSGRWTQLRNVGKGRFRIIDNLSKAAGSGSGGMTVSEFNAKIDTLTGTDLRNEVNLKGVELYHDIPKRGLPVFAAEMKKRAEANNDSLAVKLGPIQDAHVAFTRQVDELYAVKSNIAVTLYGMIEEYLSFREAVFGVPDSDAGRKAFADQRNALLEAMEPPQIQSATVVRFPRRDYAARALVYYSVSHPRSVAEVSYDVVRSSGAKIFDANQLRTAGRSTSLAYIPVHAFKTSETEEKQDVSIILRARGPAGNTASWATSTTLTVDPEGPTVPSFETQPVEDDTPPQFFFYDDDYVVADIAENSGGLFATVALPSGQATQPQQTSQLQVISTTEAPGDGTLTVVGGGSNSLRSSNYTQAAWLADSTTIMFQVAATDPETDVVQYEYALGSTRGGTDLSDGFQPAVGRRNQAGNNSASGNVSFMAELRGLRLGVGTPYYLSVRAENGAALTTTERYSTPYVVDNTRPGAPRPASTPIEYKPLDERGSLLLSDPVVQTAPAYQEYRTRSHAEYRPTATIRWAKAIDRQSGIDAYEYAVASCTDNPDTVFGDDAYDEIPGTETSLTLDERDGLSYFQAKCAYVRARNHAGIRGDVLRFGPLEPVDPSNPTVARFRLQPTATGIRVYITQAAADRETTVRGYRYRVSKQGTGTVLRDFPTDGVDTGPLCTSSPEDGFRYLASYSGSGEIAYVPGAQSQGLTVFGLGEEMTATTSTTEPATIQPAANDTTQFPVVQLQDDVFSSVADPTGCVTPYSEPNAPYFVIPTDGLPKGEKLSVAIEAVNRQGLSTQTRSSASIVLDDTPPLSPTITNVNITQFRATFDLSGVHDPESGIAEIEFAADRNMEWTRVTNLLRPHYNSRSYLDAGGPVLLPIGAKLPSEIGIRVTNTNGLHTVVWSSGQVVAQPAQNDTIQETGGNSFSKWQMNGALFFP